MKTKTISVATGILALALVLPSTTASAESDGHKVLLARATVSPDLGLTFRADMYDAPIVRNGESLLNFTLVIRCIEGCTKEVSYTESTTNHPIAVFPLPFDTGSQLATYWSGGSAAWIRIYRLSATGIEKVLDESTQTGLQLGLTAQNDPVVVVENNYDQRPKGKFEISGVVWKWDGNAYRMVDRAR